MAVLMRGAMPSSPLPVLCASTDRDWLTCCLAGRIVLYPRLPNFAQMNEYQQQAHCAPGGGNCRDRLAMVCPELTGGSVCLHERLACFGRMGQAACQCQWVNGRTVDAYAPGRGRTGHLDLDCKCASGAYAVRALQTGRSVHQGGSELLTYPAYMDQQSNSESTINNAS